jgi:hypothetical protein
MQLKTVKIAAFLLIFHVFVHIIVKKLSHSNLINKAHRQTIEAFIEKGVWKIGDKPEEKSSEAAQAARLR